MTTQHTSVNYAKKLLKEANAVHQNAGTSSIPHVTFLVTFCSQLESTMRGIKTLYRNSKSAWVYRDGEYMTLGWIGYGDFQTSKSGQPKFVVYARGITNCKYNDQTDQHHMRMAKDKETALKAARGNFLKYTPEEVAMALQSKVRQPITDMEQKASTAYRTAARKLGLDTYSSMAMRTFDALKDTMVHDEATKRMYGPDLVADINTMIAAKADTDRHSAKELSMKFVNIFEDSFGETQVSVCEISDVKTSWRASAKHEITYAVADVPEDLEGQVSVMSICDDGEFVDGIGFKVCPRAFFLYIQDVTTSEYV